MFLLGGDARALGRGGTEIGTPGGAGVIVKNPAWLSWGQGKQAEGMLILAFPRASFSGAYGSDESSWTPGVAPMLSFRDPRSPSSPGGEDAGEGTPGGEGPAVGEKGFEDRVLFEQLRRESDAAGRNFSDWGWGMGWGMGGFGGIGVLVVVLAVLGIAVLSSRRRNS